MYVQPFQPTPAALPTSLAGWMANPSPVPHPSPSAGPIALTAANNAGNYFMLSIACFTVVKLQRFKRWRYMPVFLSPRKKGNDLLNLLNGKRGKNVKA